MRCSKDQKGHILIITLLLLGLGTAVVVGSLDMTSSLSKTVASKKVRTKEVNKAEAGIQEALSWLRQNSQQLITPFRREEFYKRFEKTAPTVGANDTGNFSVPTMVKLKDTQFSAILSNDTAVVTPQFPETWDITTNRAFDAIAEFSSADLRDVKIRLTLVNALPDDPALDYGPPPAATPDTDFYPIYRIDAFTDNDKGSHFYALLSGDSNHIFDMGLYGQDYLEINQPCDSFISQNGAYSNASKRANCPAGSNSTSAIHKNEEIYGSLQTNGSINAAPPYGGETCADFEPNCPNKGETCAGEDCGVPLLEIFRDWNVYCPAGTSQAVPNPLPAELTVNSSDPTDSCWDGLKLSAGDTIKLSSTASPYYISVLDFANNSRISFEPDDPNGTIEIYTQKIVGDKLNGNMVINSGGNPTQLKIYYLGTDPLTLNGTAAIYAGIVVPNARVTVSGTFDYYGALLAKELELNGSGQFHYDESLGGSGLISDMQYKIHELSQRYR